MASEEQLSWRDVSSGQPAGTTVRVLQYNVLAQRYCREQLLPYVSAEARKWAHRRQLFRRTIEQCAPDVISMQEVDFAEWWAAQLHELGYACCYNVRPGKNEGLLLAWRASRFRAAGGEQPHLIKMDKLSGVFGHDVHAATRGAPRPYFHRGNMAMCVALHENSGDSAALLFATTHLYWDPSCDDIKLAQTEYLLWKLARWAERAGLADAPLLLSGDFNSLPDSAVYRLITDGRLDPQLRPPWSPSGAPDPHSPHPFARCLRSPAGFEHAFQLRSAYAQYLDRSAEPAYTNYTPKFVGTIDYIFFASHRAVCLRLLDIPAADLLKSEGGGLPNSRYPSDHLPIAADLVFLPGK